MIEVPHKKVRATCYLYGDDSERFSEDRARYVFMYSLVGACTPILPRIASAVRDVKLRLLPSIDPDSWALHMKILTSGHHRKRDERFAGLRRHEVEAAIGELLELISSTSGDDLWLYNIAVRGTKNSASKYDAYTALLAMVIEELTSLETRPVLCFDSEKSSKANKIVHGWARDLFKNSQHSLLYAFLAKGIEIPEPEFVTPGSHPCLELADFVGYVSARYYHHRWRGTAVEWDPRRLGKVLYAGFDQSGDLLWRRGVGYPWELFHGGRAE